MITRYRPRILRSLCLKDFIGFALFTALFIIAGTELPGFSQKVFNDEQKNEDPMGTGFDREAPKRPEQSTSRDGTSGDSLAHPVDAEELSQSQEATGSTTGLHSAKLIHDPAKFEYPQTNSTMRAYFQTKYLLAISSPLICSALMYALLQCGAISALRDRIKKRAPYFLCLIAVAGCIYLLSVIFELPTAFYSSYIVEHQFALTQQSLGGWIHDFVGRILLEALSIPLIAICFLMIRAWPRNWYLAVWLLLSSVIIFVTFVEPIIVDPVFNKFRELPDGNLKREIRVLCKKSGMENPAILVADKSKQTKKVNAYVTGLGSSNRIVVYDTLLASATDNQILAVLAHELGHYRLKHVVMGMSIAIFALLPVLLIGKNTLQSLLPWFSRKFKITSMSDPAMIAVLFIIIWLAPLLLAPLPAFVSRLIESEADAYGIRLFRDPWSAAEAFKTISAKNLSDPNPPPLVEFWFFSHPSIKHRIDYALSQLESSTTREGSTFTDEQAQQSKGRSD